jgi:hypothetical protein
MGSLIVVRTIYGQIRAQVLYLLVLQDCLFDATPQSERARKVGREELGGSRLS